MQHDQERSIRFQAMLDAARDAVIVLNHDGYVEYWNKAADRLFGYSEGEMLGHQIHDHIIPPEYRSKHQVGLARFKRTGGGPAIDHTVELPAMRKDGSAFPIELSLSRLEISKQWHAIGVVRDVSARVELESAVREAKELGDSLILINRAITSTLDFEQIMGRVIIESSKALGSEYSAIAQRVSQPDLEDQNGWEYAHTYGLPPESKGVPFHGATELSGGDYSSQVIRGTDIESDGLFDSISFVGLGLKSALRVPLLTKGELIGVLEFYFRVGDPQFSPAQIDFADQLAASISLSLENAELYEAERLIAATLQESLLVLPPEVPGIEYGRLYNSATDTAMVGGDFYDIFQIEEHRIGIAIGDVSGKGLEAATMTAEAKNTLRAYAFQGDEPSVVVAKTSHVIERTCPMNIFITGIFGIFDLNTRLFTYSSAGHPPPVLIEEDSVQLLESGHTAPLGMTAHTPPSTELRVEKGSRIVLYTDGVIEARQEGELFGEDRLLSVCSKHADASLSELPKRIVSEVEEFSGGRLADDLAILVIAFQ